jgi:hypothetical protein
MKIGSARVSITDQNPGLQLVALQRERCKRIFIDELPRPAAGQRWFVYFVAARCPCGNFETRGGSRVR